MFHLTTALDAASAVPLYEQLYKSLAAEMRSGAIAAGTRMPGKRRLAAELSVSVNTVDAAYQMLAAEGYLESRERSGFYVQEYLALPVRPEGCRCRPRQPHRTPEPPSRRCGSTCPPGGGPGAVPLPHLGPAAEGAALFLTPAADPWGCAGGPGAAAGAGRLSGRIPGGALQRRAGGGGCRNGVPAGPAGPAAAGPGSGGKPRLPPVPGRCWKITA